eukprot:NODE_205_length_12934_cov_1.115933.p1 type:complete len:1785 gc:universal NODE_205_length_12934_cov_1.115933:7129-12483(+)
MKKSFLLGSANSLRNRSASNPVEISLEKEKRKLARPVKALSPESRVNVNEMDLINIQIMIFCTKTNIVLSEESTLDALYEKICLKIKTLFGISVDVADIELQTNVGESISVTIWEELKITFQLYLHVAFTNSTVFKYIIREYDVSKYNDFIQIIARKSGADTYLTLAIVFPNKERAVVFTPRDSAIDKILEDGLKAGRSLYDFQGKKFEYGLSLKSEGHVLAPTIKLRDLKHVLAFSDDGQCPELYLQKIARVRKDAIDLMINVPNPQMILSNQESFDEKKDDKIPKKSTQNQTSQKARSIFSLNEETDEIQPIPFFVEFIIPKYKNLQVLCNTGWTLQELRNKIEKTAKDKLNVHLNCGGYNFEIEGRSITEQFLHQNSDIKKLVSTGKKFAICLVKKELYLFPSFKDRKLERRVSESDLKQKTNLRSGISDSGIQVLESDRQKIWKDLCKLVRSRSPFIGLRDTFIESQYDKLENKPVAFFDVRATFMFEESFDVLQASEKENDLDFENLDIEELISAVKFVQINLLGQIPFNLPLDEILTEEDVRKKAILKISKLLSQSLDKEDLKLFTSTGVEFMPFEVLIDNPYVLSCLKEQNIPNLLISTKNSNIILEEHVRNVKSIVYVPEKKKSQDSLDLIDDSDARYDRILDTKKLLVKVQLPMKIHTNLILSKYSEFFVILEKSNAKIISLLGQNIEIDNLDIVGEYGNEVFDVDQKVLESQYVRNCIKHNIDPSFVVKLKDSSKVKPEIRDIFNNKFIEVEDEKGLQQQSRLKGTLMRPAEVIETSQKPITVESIAKDVEKTQVLGMKKGTNKSPVSYLMRKVEKRGESSKSLDELTTTKIFIRDENGEEITQISIDTFITVGEIKKFAVTKLDSSNKAGVFVFKFYNGVQYVELFDELQVLQTTSIYKLNRDNIVLVLIEKKQHVIGPTEKKIASLLGVGYRKYELFRSDVYPILRRRLLSLCKKMQERRDLSIYHLSPEVDFSPLPSYLQKLLKENPVITLRIFSSSGPGSFKTITCTPFEKPTDVILKFISKSSAKETDAVIVDPSNYILKSILNGEFIFGDYPLISFSFFKNEIFKGKKLIELVIKTRGVQETLPSNITEDLVDESKPYISEHRALSIAGREISDVKILSQWDIFKDFRLKLLNIENLIIKDASITDIHINCGIYFGGEELCPSFDTSSISFKTNTSFNMWINFDIFTANIPKNARICITVYGKTSKKQDQDIVALGWVNVLLVDFRSHLLQGKQSYRLWPHEKGNPIGTIFTSNDKDHPLLHVKFQDYSAPVVCPDCIQEKDEKAVEVSEDTRFAIEPKDIKELDRILNLDPLSRLTEEEKSLVWRYRYCIIDQTESLPKLIRSTQWNDLNSVLEMKRLLKLYSDIPIDVALGLLDSYVSDSDIRTFAVLNLEKQLGDYQLVDLMLQLTQALKYEPRLDSELARFLLKRAVLNKSIGHRFFWYLKADIHRPDVSTLFAILIESYLLASPDHMEELIRQNILLKQMDDTALAVKKALTAERGRVLKNMLGGLKLDSGFALPLNPKLSCSGINLKKCKVMDSKKLPLWIVFDNFERYGEEIPIIYKSGDDLRQDMLTLQMLRLMEKIWHSEGLDMRLAPYGCLSTGPDMGLIEVVKNSSTVSGIQLSLGGSTAAFKEDVLDQWLRTQNPEEADYAKAVEMFTLSCAGYCVATYCLGIGDRHNDNIMLSKDGRLFHIDFGHFLGNIKRKFGIKRERAPFVLTPDFVLIIGKKDSPNFQRFLDLCIRAYIIIRRQANMFINLFAMVFFVLFR